MEGNMSSPLILIADDDPGIREVLVFQLEDAGYRVLQACHGAEALKLYQEQHPDLLLTDLRMPIKDGHALLESILEIDPFATVIVMTAYASVEAAVDIMKTGAFDFLVKPFREEQVLSALERGVQVAQLKGENRRLRQALEAKQGDDLQSSSDKMQLVYQQAHSIADTDANVLINGETGTGKEHLAQSIHRHSNRADGPWIVVNCGALPEQLVEAELFGHTKGAFTGASQAREGRIASADGGTLLLDEIGDLPLNAQVKLLRFLQEGEIQAIGADTPRQVDVRVIAATHKDLQMMMRENTFREDLYYRLNVLPLLLPPLRDRPDDILPLALTMLHSVDRGSYAEARNFTESATQRLVEHRWPGNVRELENLVQRSAVLCAEPVLQAEDLLFETQAEVTEENDELLSLDEEIRRCEQRVISRALRLTGGNRQEAAARLEVSPRTLRHKVARLREEGALL
mgnify:CR=1 FL=1